MAECYKCGGSGVISCDCNGGVEGTEDDDCPACGGSGSYTCPFCYGSGHDDDDDWIFLVNTI